MFDAVDIGRVALRLQALRDDNFMGRMVVHVIDRSLIQAMEEDPAVLSLAVALVADPATDTIHKFFNVLFADVREDADFEHAEVVAAVLVAMRWADHPHLGSTLEYFTSQRAVAVARLRYFALRIQSS